MRFLALRGKLRHTHNRHLYLFISRFLFRKRGTLPDRCRCQFKGWGRHNLREPFASARNIFNFFLWKGRNFSLLATLPSLLPSRPRRIFFYHRKGHFFEAMLRASHARHSSFHSFHSFRSLQVNLC